MKHILTAAQRELLAQLAWSNALLGFDFDGTLAPIVADPLRAEMRPSTRKLLGELTVHYPCVVISGRAMRDVQRRVAGLGLRAMIGNHGLEPWRATPDLRDTIARWSARLAPRVAEMDGVVLEDKTYSLALHYRRARSKPAALAEILRAVEDLGDLRVIRGKLVVNVLPAGVPNKGLALERERDRAGCDTALFVGDDETDEDVFALDAPGRLLTVRVGVKRSSHALYCLKSQREVDALLARLIELRQDSEVLRRRAR